MNTAGSVPVIRNFFTRLDWKLLLFLILFLDVKLVVKILAIVIIYLLRPNTKFSFNLKNPGIPLFYPVVILLAILNWVFLKGFADAAYSFVVLTGIVFWLLCMLAFHQLKLAVQQNDAIVIRNTLVAFFILNAFVCLYNYSLIVWETGVLNPYRYQANYQKYFIRTGDYIKGISFDTSTANAAINAFGVLYFLLRKHTMMVLLCMAVLLFTGSNYTNLMLLVILLYVFIFNSTKEQKAIIVCCGLLFIVFMLKVSPQNNRYIAEAFNAALFQKKPVIPPFIRPVPITERADSTLTSEERKEKIATLYIDSTRQSKIIRALPAENQQAAIVQIAAVTKEKIDIPAEDIHSQPYQSRSDTTDLQRSFFAFIKTNKTLLHYATQRYIDPGAPGKLIALKQSLSFLKEHPAKILTGAGTGNFSSRLAFRVTGLKIAGGFPSRFKYINKDFLSNHLDLYLYFFSNHIKLHSLTNTPDAVYTQLLSEYGLTGLLAFFALYVGFFIRSKESLLVNGPTLALMLGLFLAEYWFEQLSIVVIFELMMLSNLKEFSTVSPVNRKYE